MLPYQYRWRNYLGRHGGIVCSNLSSVRKLRHEIIYHIAYPLGEICRGLHFALLVPEILERNHDAVRPRKSLVLGKAYELEAQSLDGGPSLCVMFRRIAGDRLSADDTDTAFTGEVLPDIVTVHGYQI